MTIFPRESFHKDGTYISFKKVFLIIYHSAKLSLLLPRRAAAQPFDRAEVACQQSSCFSLTIIHRELYHPTRRSHSRCCLLVSLKGNQNLRRLNFLPKTSRTESLQQLVISLIDCFNVFEFKRSFFKNDSHDQYQVAAAVVSLKSLRTLFIFMLRSQKCSFTTTTCRDGLWSPSTIQNIQAGLLLTSHSQQLTFM